MLRACRPGEAPCIHGGGCRGVQMPDGYILPRMPPWTECVLCLRARATLGWLQHLGGTCPQILPVYRNVIGEGEYAAEATLQPVGPRFDGITDPIVRFAPERMRWRGETLDQSSMYYRLQPSLHHPARPVTQVRLANGLVDVFKSVAASGLLGPKGEDTISFSMQRALWSRDPLLDVTSTWVRALMRHYYPDAPHARLRDEAQADFDAAAATPWRDTADAALATAEANERELAALAVRRRIVEQARCNPVLQAALEARHAYWPEFCALVEACPPDTEAMVVLRRDLKRLAPLRANQETVEARVFRLRKRALGAETDMETCKRLHEADDKDKAFLYHVAKEAEDGVFTLPAPSHWPDHPDVGLQYVCMRCQAYKGALLQARKNVEGRPVMQGLRDVAYSLETEKLSCFKKRNNRKGVKERVLCGDLCPVRIGGRVIELFGVCYVPCFRCGVLGPRAVVENAFSCGLCEPRRKPVCEVCQEARPGMHSVRVFEDSCAKGVHAIRLCKRHNKGFIADHTLWARPLLMRRLLQEDTETANRRVTLAVHR